MSYRALKAQVAAAEDRVDAHLGKAGDQAGRIDATLRQSFTPLRLLVAGFAGGVLSGWLRPLHHAGALRGAAHLIGSMPAVLTGLTPWLNIMAANATAAAAPRDEED